MSFRSKPPNSLHLVPGSQPWGKIIAETLRQAAAVVRGHDDHFLPNAPDEEWLSEVGRRQWAVLTKDARIRYREIERMALMNAGVRAFVLTAKNLQGSEKANIFVMALPAIQLFAANQTPPFIATIPRRGSVSLLVCHHDRRRPR